jgi:hypothetical protein
MGLSSLNFYPLYIVLYYESMGSFLRPCSNWCDLIITSYLRFNCLFWIRLYPPKHLLLDSVPNLGPHISCWEINKFKNYWHKRVGILEVLKLLLHQFLNLSSSQRDMSGPRLGALSKNRWSGGTFLLVVKLSFWILTPPGHQSVALWQTMGGKWTCICTVFQSHLRHWPWSEFSRFINLDAGSLFSISPKCDELDDRLQLDWSGQFPALHLCTREFWIFFHLESARAKARALNLYSITWRQTDPLGLPLAAAP